MGIVNCANEAYGCLTDDPIKTRHFGTEWDYSIKNMTKKVNRSLILKAIKDELGLGSFKRVK